MNLHVKGVLCSFCGHSGFQRVAHCSQLCSYKEKKTASWNRCDRCCGLLTAASIRALRALQEMLQLINGCEYSHIIYAFFFHINTRAAHGSAVT